MNKKAQSVTSELIKTLPQFIFIAILAITVRLIITSYTSANLNTQNIEADVFAQRIFYSPNGILCYDDELKQSLVGCIDVSKMKNNILDNMINYNDENFIAAGLDLINESSAPVASAVYNEKTYKRWLPLVGQGGAGGVKKIERRMLVVFSDDEGDMKKGVLTISMLLPGNA